MSRAMVNRISRFAVRFAFHGNYVLCVAVEKWRESVFDLDRAVSLPSMCAGVSWTHVMCLAHPFTSYTVVVALIYSHSILICFSVF